MYPLSFVLLSWIEFPLIRSNWCSDYYLSKLPCQNWKLNYKARKLNLFGICEGRSAFLHRCWSQLKRVYIQVTSWIVVRVWKCRGRIVVVMTFSVPQFWRIPFTLVNPTTWKFPGPYHISYANYYFFQLYKPQFIYLKINLRMLNKCYCIFIMWNNGDIKRNYAVQSAFCVFSILTVRNMVMYASAGNCIEYFLHPTSTGML